MVDTLARSSASTIAPSRPQTVKLSFNVAQHQVDLLRELADKRGISMTEVLRHAIALEDFLQKEADRGNSLIVETPKGERKQLVLLGH